VEHVRLKEVRRLAIQLVRADPSATPLVHILRWPGSWHRKNAPRLARIIELNADAEVDLDQAFERLQAAAAPTGAANEESGQQRKTSAEPEADIFNIISALAAMPNDDVHWKTSVRIGLAAWRATGGSALRHGPPGAPSPAVPSAPCSTAPRDGAADAGISFASIRPAARQTAGSAQLRSTIAMAISALIGVRVSGTSGHGRACAGSAMR
jgi:hypothetical protein